MKKKHNKRKPKYLCPYPGCNYRIVTESGLVSHIDGFHGEKVVCGKCGSSHHKRNIALHERECGIEIQCSLCPAIIRATYINIHMKNAHRESRRVKVACDICGKVVQKRLLGEHVKHSHTPDDQMPHRCANCGKGFFNKYKLVRHMESCGGGGGGGPTRKRKPKSDEAPL